MNEIDALGPLEGRGKGFSPQLLSEAHDEELEKIVEVAAAELHMPIALVSLVLDQVQYFKAHRGLPPDLARARATDRDVSFCQFVVRDGLPFEVTDAEQDERVPKHLVEQYGVRSYLGMPLRVGDTVVGSLCVIDTNPHAFSKSDHEIMERLAKRVSQRLASFTEGRQRLHRQLAEEVATKAIAEMNRSLVPLFEGLSDALSALPGVRAALKQYRHTALDGEPVTPEVIEQTLASAERALEQLEESLHELDASSIDCSDTLVGLELLSAPAPKTDLGDVLFAAQDLARAVTRPIGGAVFDAFPEGTKLALPRPLAVTLLATALMRVGEAAGTQGIRTGIGLEFAVDGAWLEVRVVCTGLKRPLVVGIAGELGRGLSLDPSRTARVIDGSLVLGLPIAGTEG